MSSPEKTQGQWEEQRLRSLLEAAGKRPQPPEPQRQEWEALFRGEIGKVVADRRQRQRIRWGAAAAVVVAAVAVFLLVNPQPQPTLLAGEVVSATDGNRTYFDGRRLDPLTVGSPINVGQTVHTESAGSLALAYRGADVRLKGSTMVRFHTAHIELMAGAVYVDTQGHSPSALPVIIATELGTFSHVGTQFMVAVEQDRAVTAAVREGTIMLRTDDVQKNFSASADGAELVRISATGSIDTTRVPRTGPSWSWVTEASPGKVIDGLSADEILRWIARESGTRLNYADDASAQVARRSTSRAPQQPMSPARALSFLVQTTSLRVEQTDANDMLVRSESD